MNDNDNETFFSVDEAFNVGFKPKIEQMLEQKLAEKSARLRALGILDQMDQAAADLGLENINKAAVAQHMKDTDTFDPKQAVVDLYGKNQTSNQTSQPEPASSGPMTKGNLAEKLHQAFSSQEPEEESLEIDIEALQAKLMKR